MNNCPVCVGNPPQRVDFMPKGGTKHTCMQCGYVQENNDIPELYLEDRTIACQLGAIVCHHREATTVEEQALIGQAVSEIPYILEGNWQAVSDSTVGLFYFALTEMPIFQQLEGMDMVFDDLKKQHEPRFKAHLEREHEEDMKELAAK